MHQKCLPRCPTKVTGLLLRSVLLLAHHSTKRPRIALGCTNVRAFHEVSRIGCCKTFSVHYFRLASDCVSLPLACRSWGQSLQPPECAISVLQQILLHSGQELWLGFRVQDENQTRGPRGLEHFNQASKMPSR